MRDQGFTDATALLRGGVFVLRHRGKVVYVGKATGPMLPKIANLRGRDRPSWLPRVTFDEVLIRHIHPDLVNDLYLDLIAEFQPKHNIELAAINSRSPTVIRRVLA